MNPTTTCPNCGTTVESTVFIDADDRPFHVRKWDCPSCFWIRAAREDTPTLDDF